MSCTRRTLMTNTLLGSIAAGWALKAGAFTRISGPPVARMQPVTDVLWGERIVDPYRWMENRDDPEFIPFMRGQDAYARKILAGLPERHPILSSLRRYDIDRDLVIWPKHGGDRQFFERREAGQETFVLHVREPDGTQHALFDPSSIGEGASINWWQPSPDGRHVVLGVAQNGNEAAEGFVVDVGTGNRLPDRLAHVPYAGPAWLPDSSGFFYNRFAGKPPGDADYYKGRSQWLHKLGATQDRDRLIVDASTPGVILGEYAYPDLQISLDGEFGLLRIFEGYVRTFALYLAPLRDIMTGRPSWRRIFTPESGVQSVAISGDTLYALAAEARPLPKLMALSARDGAWADAREVPTDIGGFPSDIFAADRGVVVVSNDGGYQSLHTVAADRPATKIALPFEGWIQGVDVSHNGKSILARITSWLEPGQIFAATTDGAGVRRAAYQPDIPFDLSSYELRREFAVSADGTKVPVSILSRRDRGGRGPVLVHAYGAYQWPSQPNFNPSDIAFLDAGGVVATAHVRGGGEYGAAWHEGGRKENKPNTWLDLIASCERLIELGLAERGRIGIHGASAGGIAVGRAMTTRPDLFGAVISRVGMSNPLRAEFEPNGGPNIPEFGTVKEEAGFRALKAMDSYHAVRDGVDYPAVLLITGINDPRVEPYNAAKMVARLQRTSPAPEAIMRVDWDGGHVGGGDREARLKDTAEELAFVLHHCRSY